MQRKLYTGAFPELQARFIREVSAQRKLDPLAPLDVAVTGQLVRLSLRRELALAGCSHAGIRFRTLTDLAREEAAPLLREQELRPLREATLGPLMTRAIETAGPLHYFSRIASRGGFRRAVWRTLNDLRGANVSSAMLHDVLDKRKRLFSETLHRKLSDHLAIWERLEALMHELRLVDDVALLDLACSGPDAPNEKPLIIFYGFADLTALERRFCQRLSQRDGAAAYLPYRDAAACEWVKPLRDFFRSLGFDEVPLDPPAPDAGALSQLKHELFEEIASTPTELNADDDSLRVVSVPTRQREVEEVVRGVLLSPLRESLPQRRVAVLLRESESYVPMLRAELARAGVLGYFHQCRTLGETPVGRAFRLLADLLDERFRRADVMEFLLASPARWPEALPNGPTVIPAAQWNHYSLEAAITSGGDSWHDGLRRLIGTYERAVDHTDDEDERRSGDVSSLADMRDYLSTLFPRLRGVNAARTWTARAGAFLALFEELVDTGDKGEVLRDEMAHLSDLDALHHPPTVENFREQIAEILTRPAEREGRFQHHEPTIASFREALGVLFDEVFVPGLVEKEIPRPSSQDPLLLDDERALLSKALPRHTDIPTSGRSKARERFLFWCALTSAKRRVTLSYPRRDSGQNRERLPSTFLLHVVEALDGGRADYSALDRFLAESPLAVRVGADRLRLATSTDAVTPLQYDLARLGEALAARSMEPIRDLLNDQPFFARAAHAENERFRSRDFTPFDGLIVGAETRHRLGSWFRAHGFPLAPTAMQSYAGCPFRYFGERVLDLNAIDEAEEIQTLHPLDRGALVHAILYRFYSQARDEARLPLTADALPRLEALAAAAFERFEQTGVTGLHLLWQIEQKRMMHWLRALVRHDIGETTRFLPTLFEHAFTFTLRGQPGLTFKGKIDRIDQSPEGGARVIDYKTGKQPRTSRENVFTRGRALQLPVYLQAAETALNLRVEVACYYYLRDAAHPTVVPFTHDDWDEHEDEFVRVAQTILNGIEAGRFFPHPERQQCESCPMRPACGAGRLTMKWAHDLETTRDYRAMAGTDE